MGAYDVVTVSWVTPLPDYSGGMVQWPCKITQSWMGDGYERLGQFRKRLSDVSFSMSNPAIDAEDHGRLPVVFSTPSAKSDALWTAERIERYVREQLNCYFAGNDDYQIRFERTPTRRLLFTVEVDVPIRTTRSEVIDLIGVVGHPEAVVS